MKKLWNSFKIAFAMYSKIPMPKADWDKENMRYIIYFTDLSVVGRALLIAWSFLAERVGAGAVLRSAVYVLIPVLVTGGIHLDGLLDTADALSSYQPRERKLEILKDSNAGAFAVITACCYFLASFGIWSELGREEVRLLAGVFVFSRSLSGLGVAAFPCAKSTGTLAMFSDAVQEKIVLFCLYVLLFLSAGYMCVLNPKLGTAAVTVGWLTFFGYYRMSMKQFGGITGDLAGFFLEVCELASAAAVFLAARW